MRPLTNHVCRHKAVFQPLNAGRHSSWLPWTAGAKDIHFRGAGTSKQLWFTVTRPGGLQFLHTYIQGAWHPLSPFSLRRKRSGRCLCLQGSKQLRGTSVTLKNVSCMSSQLKSFARIRSDIQHTQINAITPKLLFLGTLGSSSTKH